MRIEPKIINAGDKKILLRNATEQDAGMLIDYLRITCGETRFLVKEPDEINLTLEQEKEFINQNNHSENALLILAFLDGEYVGNCSLTGMNASRYKHRASVGIALYQRYTGRGIGRAMLEWLCVTAKEKGFEQLELEVVSSNERAVRLYQRIGFQIYGTFPDNMKYKDGTYTDAYWMMKKL